MPAMHLAEHIGMAFKSLVALPEYTPDVLRPFHSGKLSNHDEAPAAIKSCYSSSLFGGFGSPVVKVPDQGRRVMSSSPVLLKSRRLGQRCTFNLSRAETSYRWCGVVVRRRGVPAEVSSTSLDNGSKLCGPSPKALV
ncbi:uncharacterized protein TNCV_4107661 [Trichonephila clavipes]|nr:uncharacterized protein TNCV_4107661 [Trichonephila clavipes]